MELPEKEIAKQVEDGVLLFAMLKQVAAIVAESLLFVTITATCLAMILAVARYNITLCNGSYNLSRNHSYYLILIIKVTFTEK